jgi:hypothetical protein
MTFERSAKMASRGLGEEDPAPLQKKVRGCDTMAGADLVLPSPVKGIVLPGERKIEREESESCCGDSVCEPLQPPTADHARQSLQVVKQARSRRE